MSTDTVRRGPGPSPTGLVFLVVAALAMIATSAGIPSLEGRAIGEVALRGGESVERDVRVHVEPEGGRDVDAGTIYVTFLAGSGLDRVFPRDGSVAIVAAADAKGSFAPGTEIPVERCLTGCDLVYRMRFTPDPTVLPGSVARFRVDVEFRYKSGYGGRDPAWMRVEVDGPASGPVPSVWAVIAGLLAVVLGIFIAVSVDARLGLGRRRWPAIALTVSGLGFLGWTIATRIGRLFDVPAGGGLPPLPILLLYLLEPWSVVVLTTLVWGMVRGVRRWPHDGGWSLGLSAVAMAGLGGLWLTWWATLEPVVQPGLSIVVAAAVGMIAGVVIGQAWRMDARTRHDRWWAGVAVLAHGILVAGFGFLVVQSVFDPFQTLTALPLVIPAGLVLVAFRRWFGGRRRWLILFDVLIAAVGLLGTWMWFSNPFGLNGKDGVLIDDVAILIACGAAIVATVTAFHVMPSPPLTPTTPVAPPISSPVPTVADPATP